MDLLFHVCAELGIESDQQLAKVRKNEPPEGGARLVVVGAKREWRGDGGRRRAAGRGSAVFEFTLF